MTNVVLCPKCGGRKEVYESSFGADSGTPLYQCPLCDGRGWIRVDPVSQDDFDNMKSVALSSMETAENLMDECTKRADRIKELETELERTRAGERAADKEIERLRMKIFDIEGLEDLVTTELEADILCFRSAVKGFRALVGEKDIRIEDLETQRDFIGKTRDTREKELLEIINDLTNENKRLEAYHDCVRDVHQAREMEFATVSERYEIDLGLLDEMLKVVNPLIKSGTYANRDEELLTRQMHSLCQTVVRFRRDHNIVG